MEFRLLKGNIVDAKTDAIVLPANTKLKEGSGASEVIFHAAGKRDLTKACKEIGFCEEGSAVPTLAFAMDAKYIVHAVVPRWIDGNHREYELLCSAYASALELADVMFCESIAFPLLASGNNRFDAELAFEIAVNSFKAYKPQNLKDIVLVVYNNQTAQMAQSAGYNVGVLPVDLSKEEEMYKKKLERRQKQDEFKKAAGMVIHDQLIKGIEYFQDEEHRNHVIDLADKILAAAMIAKNKKRNLGH